MIIQPNNEEAQAPTPEGPYDFDYLCRYCGLIQTPSGASAFNPQHVICAVRRDDGGLTLFLPEHHMIDLEPEEAPKMVIIMKEREAAAHKWRAEAIEREAKLNMQAQINAGNDAIAQAAMMNKLNKGPRGS